MRRYPKFLLIGILSVLLIGCNTTTNSGTPTLGHSLDSTNHSEYAVHGVVLEVTSKSALELNELLIQDGQEKNWTLKGKGFAGKTPAHLRQHSLLGQPVTVFYHKDDLGILIITRIID